MVNRGLCHCIAMQPAAVAPGVEIKLHTSSAFPWCAVARQERTQFLLHSAAVLQAARLEKQRSRTRDRALLQVGPGDGQPGSVHGFLGCSGTAAFVRDACGSAQLAKASPLSTRSCPHLCPFFSLRDWRKRCRSPPRSCRPPPACGEPCHGGCNAPLHLCMRVGWLPQYGA